MFFHNSDPPVIHVEIGSAFTSSLVHNNVYLQVCRQCCDLITENPNTRRTTTAATMETCLYYITKRSQGFSEGG